MNIGGKMMLSAGGAVLATILVGAAGLYGMSKINSAIEAQVAVGSLIKQHMAADLTRATLATDRRAAHLSRTPSGSAPAGVPSDRTTARALRIRGGG